MSQTIESFYQGETKTWVLTFTRNSAVIDLTADGGATVYMTVKAQKSAADGTATADSDGVQITVTDGTNVGVATVTMSSTQTSLLSVEQTYYYDFRLVEGGGTVTTVPGGAFTLKEPITKATT